jgi:hypothetical protein
MRRFLFFVIVVPLAIIAVALSVANRESVTVSLDPSGTLAGHWTVALPLYVLLFAVLAVGVVIGGIAAWLGQSKWRYAARAERDNTQRLRREVERLRELAGRPTIPSSFDRDAA